MIESLELSAASHVATDRDERLVKYDEANRNLRSARPALQFGRRSYLVEQPAIDRCLWTEEDDAALGVTKEV